jgi:hypothetical protein
LFSEVPNDYLGEDNPVRAIDVFVDELRLGISALTEFNGIPRVGRPIVPRRCLDDGNAPIAATPATCVLKGDSRSA